MTLHRELKGLASSKAALGGEVAALRAALAEHAAELAKRDDSARNLVSSPCQS